MCARLYYLNKPHRRVKGGYVVGAHVEIIPRNPIHQSLNHGPPAPYKGYFWIYALFPTFQPALG